MTRIISWNVNGLRANTKKGGFDWLINETPDIFCLQEVKAEASQLDEGVRNPPGYHSYFDHSKGRKGYSGVAVYSRIEPQKVEYGLGVPELDLEGRFLALYYKDYVLLNIYFPNGGGGPDRLSFKLRYYQEFLKYIDRLVGDGLEVIFCGDINTAHREIDLARPKENESNTGFLPIERAWIDQVIDHGFADVYRKFYPDRTGAYTYWDMKTYARDRNVGWRIDYFFASPGILQKIDNMTIHDAVMGSDHCPIEISVG